MKDSWAENGKTGNKGIKMEETDKNMQEEKKSEKEIKIGSDKIFKYSIIGVIVIAFIIRVYYFFHTPGQTLWWDEAEYMATAKHWAFGVPYNLNPQRPPLFQALAALIFALGAGENVIKFVLTLLPSVALVYAVYLLGKEMYSKEVGLIGAFLAAVSWTFLFWTDRVQPDFFSMFFQVLAVYFMWKYWKGYNENKPRNNMAIYAAIFAALGFYFKVSALLVPLVFIVFILVKDRWKGFEMKGHWYFAAAYIATLVPYFIWSQITFGTPFAFRAGYSNALGTAQPFAWYTMSFFYSLLDNLSFVLFAIGLILALKFVLYPDLLAKDRKKCFDSDIFSVILFVLVSAFYIFYIRGAEDRWVFIWLPFMFYIIGNLLVKIYNWGRKKSAIGAFIVVILILGIVGFSQVQAAGGLIDMKKDSYAPVRDAGLWMKANSNPGDGIFSVSYTQTVYYTERNVTTYSLIPQLPNSTEFDKMVLADKPRYIMWSIFETHPSWTIEWIQKHMSKGDIQLVYGVPISPNSQQPALAVFAPDYSKFGVA